MEEELCAYCNGVLDDLFEPVEFDGHEFCSEECMEMWFEQNGYDVHGNPIEETTEE